MKTVSAEKVASMWAEKLAARTFPQARAEILALLKKKDWDVVPNLKVPHATLRGRPGIRLWFKAQAVYYEKGSAPFNFGSAHTVSYDLDIRKMSAEQFLSFITKRFDL